MSEWMKHVHWKEVFISGLIYTVWALVLRQIEVAFTMKYYTDPFYGALWSRLMMPSNGPPPPVFYMVSIIFTLATGVTLAAVFDFTKALFGKGYWQRVVGFTDIMVGLSIVFGYFPMYLMINLPAVLIGIWLITTFFTMILSAMVFAKRLR